MTRRHEAGKIVERAVYQMKRGMISPSIMCCDFGRLMEQLQIMESAKVDYLHMDITDGIFVPNYTMGADMCRFMKDHSSIPLDIHTMIINPEQKIDWFPFGEGDYVSVHYEAGFHILKALQAVRKRGAKAMVALNPATPVDMIENLLDDIDGVLIMTVNPGFAGQKLVACAEKKVKKTRAFLDERGCQAMDIQVDGNISLENAAMLRKAGATIFVGGTSSLFTKDGNLEENIARLRAVIL